MTKLQIVQSQIAPYSAQLVAVSKLQENEKIMLLYDQGQRVFSENRPQELARKYNELPKDIEWHLIGHLQQNKVRMIVPIVHLIHSVDSFELAKKINAEAKLNFKKVNILLQIKLSKEESKHGFNFTELINSLQRDFWSELNNIEICGVMGIGSLTSEPSITRQEFKQLKNYFEELKSNYFKINEFKEISMGMSADFQIALEEGATMVRIGSLIF
ncbi:MAG: YggS family pyridoxal phosphate-dependent enzyme [Saprospiraceae bacterium]